MVRVSYTSGATMTVPVEDWPNIRGDGVDEVTLILDEIHTHRLSGHSLYWLYREEDAWVIGCGTVGNQPLTAEGVYHDDGRTEARPLEWMPDLRHSEIKLGWWRPGTVGRVIP